MSERFVTSTIEINVVSALCFDLAKGQTVTKSLPFGVDLDTQNALKAVRKACETDTFKVVAVSGIETEKALYRMTEERYLELATPIPPRGEGGRTRERVITRTVTKYVVTALCFDVKSAKMTPMKLSFGVNFDTQNALKAVRKACETDTFKVVAVSGIETETQLYKLNELEFLRNAEKVTE